METSELLSDYELERGKPVPSLNHAYLQKNLLVVLEIRYRKTYDILPELELELTTGRATPDLCIYPNLQYDWEEDVIRMKEPPFTTIEILSPRQAIDDLISKIRKIYFPAGVKSAWVVVPPFKTIHILYPDQPTVTFTQGPLIDPATAIELPMEEIFR